MSETLGRPTGRTLQGEGRLARAPLRMNNRCLSVIRLSVYQKCNLCMYMPASYTLMICATRPGCDRHRHTALGSISVRETAGSSLASETLRPQDAWQEPVDEALEAELRKAPILWSALLKTDALAEEAADSSGASRPNMRLVV